MLQSLKKMQWGWACMNSFKKMGKFNPKNQMKTITLGKWLAMLPNRRHYEHPFVAPPNLDVNLTSLKHNEPLSHAHHESLHQIDED
jgi:hypothetical protein